jgi:hypothetical protein
LLLDGEDVIYCTIYPCLVDMAGSTKVKRSWNFEPAGRGLFHFGLRFSNFMSLFDP